MREILFRGKRKDSGEWIYGVPITDKATNNVYIITSTAGASLKSEINNLCATGFRVISDTVGQYTGLTDKNGLTKIFEGDIVTCNYFCGVVNFHEGAWCVTEEDKCPEYLYDLIDLKIIGNIYDNPELLKGE